MGSVMNYVGEKPIKDATLRIAPFHTDGEAVFVTPINEECLSIKYTAQNGKHKIEVTETDLSLKLDVVGPPQSEIDLQV